MRLFKMTVFVVTLGLFLVGDAAAQAFCSIGPAHVQQYNQYLDQAPSPRPAPLTRVPGRGAFRLIPFALSFFQLKTSSFNSW